MLLCIQQGRVVYGPQDKSNLTHNSVSHCIKFVVQKYNLGNVTCQACLRAHIFGMCYVFL